MDMVDIYFLGKSLQPLSDMTLKCRLTLILFWVVYFEFQVYMFSNGRDMTKWHIFLHDDAKVIAITRVSPKTAELKIKNVTEIGTNILHAMSKVKSREMPEKNFYVWKV